MLTLLDGESDGLGLGLVVRDCGVVLTLLDGESDGLAGEVRVALLLWDLLHKLGDHHPRDFGSLLDAWFDKKNSIRQLEV